MPPRIAVLSGPPADTTRLANSLRKRLGAGTMVVRVAGDTPLILFRPGRHAPPGGGGAGVARTRPIDSEEMNHLLSGGSLRALIVDRAADPVTIDRIKSDFSRFVTVHIHLSPGPIPPCRPAAGPARRRVPALRGATPELAQQADAVIDTKKCAAQDVLARAAARLQAARRNTAGYVDVIVGGQYGSEGKGQIAAYLAREYDLLVRVGGPNAGHTVPAATGPYVHHHLPSGTLHSSARLALGPGSVINVANLLREIAECKIPHDRLAIDPNAAIIEQDDIEEEEKTVRQTIASTAQGVGRATIRKMERDPGNVRLARDAAELAPFVRPTLEMLEDALSGGGKIMLEGSQGTGLSIHHGRYPHVTTRETTASGCLADAGIGPRHVRRVIMVARTYPIRVGGRSGPMSRQIEFEEISRRSKKRLEDIVRTEKGSTTGRPRRIGEFEWDLIARAALLNGATDVALTFADYISADNERARRFEQLTPETIGMVEEIEAVTEAPVSLIASGPRMRSIIDRRDW